VALLKKKRKGLGEGGGGPAGKNGGEMVVGWCRLGWPARWLKVNKQTKQLKKYKINTKQKLNK
jgi:hypothetical protein